MRRGGGISNAYAVIAVIYPSGSTCTCTKGTKTLRAKDTSGSYLFLIPEAGTWTVSCTDGSSTASKTVNITMQYQTESVTLSYRSYVFKEGVNPGTIENVWSTPTGSENKWLKSDNNTSYQSGGYIFVSTKKLLKLPKIDLSNVNAVGFEVSIPSNSPAKDGTVGMGVTNTWNFDGQPSFAAYANAENVTDVRKTYHVDVSYLTGEYWICLYASTGPAMFANVYNVWLE